jgi:hypothetical protein
MARRDLLTGDERRALSGVPSDRASLAKFYTVMPEHRSLIEARRGDALLVTDQKGGVTPLAWLRDPGDSPSARNLAGILARSSYLRDIGIDTRVTERIHERRFRQLLREGAVAPAFLLSDYSPRRRRATLAAAMIDLESRLADAAIEMFRKQTGLLFAKARASQKRRYEATTNDVGRLMRLFESTIGTLRVAREDGLNPWVA